jgi:plasmid maintenance system antidote protein VapI
MHPLERWRLAEQKRRGTPLRWYQLAKELRCSPSRLSQIVVDGEMPSSDLAIRIRDLTGISTDKILDAAKEIADARAA